jgi:hypothetical protein
MENQKNKPIDFYLVELCSFVVREVKTDFICNLGKKYKSVIELTGCVCQRVWSVELLQS